MSKAHTPVWLSDDDIEEIPFQNDPKSSSSSSSSNQLGSKELKEAVSGSTTIFGASKNKIIFWSFRVVAIFLSLLMLCTSLVGLSK